MRVNSICTGVSTNKLLGKSGIVIVMLIIFFIASSFTEHADRYLRTKQVNLMIRQIGHRLLLQAGDSTSRVLPVTEISKGTFLLRFENEFVFNHDSLLVLSRALLPKSQFPPGYTVTVQDCLKGGIVYGFQVSNTSPDILACSGRSQPPGCYTIEFAFPDFYENVEPIKANIDQLTKPVKADLLAINPKQEESKTTTVNNNVDLQKEEFKSLKVNPRDVHPKQEKLKSTTFGYPSIKVLYVSMLVLLVVTLLIWRFRKIIKTEPLLHQNPAISKESDPDLAALGKFSFNVKGQRLLLGSEMISLTDKECRVLELLHKNFGELLPRETLMQEVWINEGVITGRSLDMFISKLRKKLGVDPDLRITNVHGKGYRLETVNDAMV